MIDEIEGFGLEDQPVGLSGRNDRESLLHGDIPALKARTVHLIARCFRRKGARSRFLEHVCVKPKGISGIVWRTFF